MGRKTTAEHEPTKSVLVLTDSDLLFFIIKTNLQQPHLRIALHNSVTVAPSFEANTNSRQTVCNNQFDMFPKADLIIVAHSAQSSEPVVTLAQAHLTDQIGCVPILIISDRPFEAKSVEQIYHLDFPFDSVDLRHTVESLLANG